MSRSRSGRARQWAWSVNQGRASPWPRGAEVHGSIRFGGSDVNRLAGADLRRYRNQVAMIFQDPRAHTNPVRRIGDFMTEALQANLAVSAAEARRRAIDMLTQV